MRVKEHLENEVAFISFHSMCIFSYGTIKDLLLNQHKQVKVSNKIMADKFFFLKKAEMQIIWHCAA